VEPHYLYRRRGGDTILLGILGVGGYRDTAVGEPSERECDRRTGYAGEPVAD
jgi:hypothetical protein